MMASQNSFDTRTSLTVGGQHFRYLQPSRAREGRFYRRRAAAVFAEDPAREPAAPRGRPVRQSRRHPGAGGWDVTSRRAEGDCLHAGARAAAGLHRRSRRRRSRGHARRHRRARRRSDAVNPLQPVELVIDHSVQVDHYCGADAFELNAELEFARNRERYAFLRWGQEAFHNFRVVPPDTGIVHQVNLEYLARVVFRSTARPPRSAAKYRGQEREG